MRRNLLLAAQGKHCATFCAEAGKVTGFHKSPGSARWTGTFCHSRVLDRSNSKQPCMTVERDSEMVRVRVSVLQVLVLALSLRFAAGLRGMPTNGQCCRQVE